MSRCADCGGNAKYGLMESSENYAALLGSRIGLAADDVAWQTIFGVCLARPRPCAKSKGHNDLAHPKCNTMSLVDCDRRHIARCSNVLY